MNLLTIAFYELRRIFRNHRLVLIVISQPIVLSIIIGLLVFQDPKDLKIGIVSVNENKYSSKIIDKIVQNDVFDAKRYYQIDEQEIKNGSIRAFVEINIRDSDPVSGIVKIYHDPAGSHIKYSIVEEISSIVADESKEIAIENIKNSVQSDLKKIIPQLALTLPEIKIENQAIEGITLENKEMTPFALKHFDYFASAVMVLMIILVVINLSSISITNERASGTFERLFVTPYSKSDVIFGKAIALFLVGVIVTILGTATLHYIFNASIGSLWLVALINVLVGATAVTLGLLVSSVTYSVVESAEVAIYIFFISVLTTGIFSPIEQANKYFAYVMKAVPFYYAVDASRRVNMVDARWENIAVNIYILCGSFLFFLLLSILLLRREAK